jgi:hypothetical protein
VNSRALVVLIGLWVCDNLPAYQSLAVVVFFFHWLVAQAFWALDHMVDHNHQLHLQEARGHTEEQFLQVVSLNFLQVDYVSEDVHHLSLLVF